ncbi:Krueppel-like factor 1 [Platysternon megacephalum]|uniref:Krueppel-like factor 1 n=1 Tax=Platysternon megacephalum TaxID=55544 RepID=A0A4D9DGQ8_9SAUR|nr:Krueppel-like factor 1 [Platysternon megacephalum]
MVGVIAMYWVKYRSKERRQRSVHVPLNPDVPLTCLPGDPKPLGPPGLPSYQEALEASGVHDAPPPPYPSTGLWEEAGRTETPSEHGCTMIRLASGRRLPQPQRRQPGD